MSPDKPVGRLPVAAVLLLAALQSQGATKVARGPGNKPFVPFEQWQYSLPRYRQYVADLAAVHQALEEALQLALAATSQPAAAAAAHSDEPPQSSSSSSTQGSSLASAIAALSCFSCDCGIWRSQAAKADLQALAQLAAAQQQQQQQQASGPSPARSKDASVQASQTAVAYGKYLQQLGKAAGAAAGPQPPAVEEQDEACAAALKLLAHAYALHTQQQCLGTRIGAAATDALSLMSAGGAGVSRATAVYLDYPPHVREPLQQLVQATDAAGRLLGPEGRQAVMDELPRALTKATLVLAPLATA